MKVFRIVKAFVGLVRDDETAPSPNASELAHAINAKRPARPSAPDGMSAHRKATSELAAELQKSHSPIGPAPKRSK